MGTTIDTTATSSQRSPTLYTSKKIKFFITTTFLLEMPSVHLFPSASITVSLWILKILFFLQKALHRLKVNTTELIIDTFYRLKTATTMGVVPMPMRMNTRDCFDFVLSSFSPSLPCVFASIDSFVVSVCVFFYPERLH